MGRWRPNVKNKKTTFKKKLVVFLFQNQFQGQFLTSWFFDDRFFESFEGLLFRGGQDVGNGFSQSVCDRTGHRSIFLGRCAVGAFMSHRRFKEALEAVEETCTPMGL
jgi:hypothetical protein